MRPVALEVGTGDFASRRVMGVVPASGGPRSATTDAAYSVISEFKNRSSNADGGEEPEALYAV
jgi:hypothetical protein